MSVPTYISFLFSCPSLGCKKNSGSCLAAASTSCRSELSFKALLLDNLQIQTHCWCQNICVHTYPFHTSPHEPGQRLQRHSHLSFDSPFQALNLSTYLQISLFHCFTLHNHPFLVGNFSNQNHGENTHMVARKVLGLHVAI